MNFLFVHQNMPGQYREMVQWLVAQGGHRVVFLTQRKQPPKIDGVQTVVYRPHHVAGAGAYGLSRVWEDATGTGYGAAIAARKLSEDGFVPDIILGHSGWGELLFLRQVWPDVPILGLFEYYYQSQGGTVGFDPEEPASEDSAFLLQARNAVPASSIQIVDQGVAPTRWQKERFPSVFQDRLTQCHDGIRTDRLLPDETASVALGRLGRSVTRQDEVITYVARNLERTRGFHVLMRALPRILSERPQARIIIVGGNETSYGAKSATPGGLRAEMEAEIGRRLDWNRVHFLGRVPYDDFRRIIQISRCHIYLTMPFVLSWSVMEAMSMQATIVASDVAPVREVIEHGRNGLLVDYFDPDALATQVIAVLRDHGDFRGLGQAARADMVRNYDFLTRAMPAHARLIGSLVPNSPPLV